MKNERANEIADKIIKHLKDNHSETLNIDFHWPSFIPSLHDFIITELKKVKEVDSKKKKDIMYDGRCK